MTRRLLEATIREYVDKDKAGRLAFAIQSATPWTGPAQIEIKGFPVHVAQCRSMLEMREYLGLGTVLPDSLS